MKRALVVTMAVWACTSVPPGLDGGTSGGGTGGTAGGGTAGAAGGSAGGATGGGMAGDGGCTTACNCAPGYSCYNGECIAGTVPVYCCSDRPCPPGDFCQQPAGPFDRCLAPDGGRPDGGGKFDGGTPRDGGRIIDGGCLTACDCTPPEGCFNRRCVSGPTDIYCCKDPVCPDKEVCQGPGGGYDTCGNDGGGGPFDAGRIDAGRKQCTTACDCSPGLMCASGTCLAGFAPVYCCGSAVCPMGSQCQTDGGVYGSCP